jgi:PAP2 superfamily protein
MLNVQVTWHEAGIASVVVLALALLAALVGRRRAGPGWASAAKVALEAGLLLGLYALWQFAGSLSASSPRSAEDRAVWIWHVERVLHLPSEAALQQAFLPHPLLVQALNLYYAVLHFPVLIGCLIWLFVRHRGRYWQIRATVLLFTAGSLLIQFISVAPPRLLPGVGMSDTGLAYGQSVYAPGLKLDPAQLAAMPSVHVGWALLVAVAIIITARSRWRWLWLLYPVLTTLAVVVTANHFWLDGIAAAALLVLTLAVQRLTGQLRPVVVAQRQRAHRPVGDQDVDVLVGQPRGERLVAVHGPDHGLDPARPAAREYSRARQPVMYHGPVRPARLDRVQPRHRPAAEPVPREPQRLRRVPADGDADRYGGEAVLERSGHRGVAGGDDEAGRADHLDSVCHDRRRASGFL